MERRDYIHTEHLMVCEVITEGAALDFFFHRRANASTISPSPSSLPLTPAPRVVCVRVQGSLSRWLDSCRTLSSDAYGLGMWEVGFIGFGTWGLGFRAGVKGSWGLGLGFRV
jgi:hypothetical protein